MRRLIALFLLVIFICFWLTSIIGFLRSSETVEGATKYELIGQCSLIHFDTRLQPIETLVLACPKADMIRLWPLPVLQPWFENWWEFRRGEFEVLQPQQPIQLYSI